MQRIDELQLAELLKRIKNNDSSAYREFFCEFQPSVYYFLYRYTSDPDAADDLTQETFINFWNHRDGVDINKSPKAYLYRIARNLALNYVTRKPPVSSFGNTDILIQLSNNPYRDYDRLFLMDEFQKAINLLPERCRATFILSRYEGLDYSEIADVLNVSLQTVKNQMNKALCFFRKHLAHHLN